jgi:hypothetical protein
MSRIATIFIWLFILFPIPAHSFGERFKVETTGTEYCGDFDVAKLTAANNTDLWVEVVSDTELLVSMTANFQSGTTFSMIGVSYQTKNTTAAFVAGQQFVNGGYVTVQGLAKFSAKTGAVTSLSGTFAQFNMFNDNCFSSGKFKTVQRIP